GEQAQRAPSHGDAEQATGESQSGGLRKDEQDDVSALPSQGAQDADLAGALEDRHGHGIGDAENADEESDGRCAPGHGMSQRDNLVVGGALGGGIGSSAGQSGLNGR